MPGSRPSNPRMITLPSGGADTRRAQPTPRGRLARASIDPLRNSLLLSVKRLTSLLLPRGRRSVAGRLRAFRCGVPRDGLHHEAEVLERPGTHDPHAVHEVGGSAHDALGARLV